MMKKTTIALILVFMVLSLVMVGCGSEPAPSAADLAKGQELVESRCTSCHSLDLVADARYGKTGWETTVMRMVSLGTALNHAEQVKVVEYLAATYH